MRKILLFLGVLILTLGLCTGVGSATLHTIIDDNSIIYEDEEGTDILVIDHNAGVTIANYTTGNTYTTMTVTSTLDATSITSASIVTAGGIACADEFWLGDDIDMTTNTTGIYDITLNTNQADALSIVDDAPGDLIVFCTTTGSQSVTITPATTITGALTATGGITSGAAITVGSSGAGFDVTFYGDNANSDFVWDQDGDTNVGTLTLGANTDGVDFKVFSITTGNYLLWDQNTDDLLLVGTATQLHIAGTTTSTTPTTGSLKTAGGLGVAENVNIGGTLTVSTDGAGTDVKIYGNTASYYVWFNADGDANGAWYFGADTKGLMVVMYGGATGAGVFWDPNTDTNGALTIGVDATGNDVTMFGDTTGIYWKWDQSADTVTTTAGAVIAPIAAGTFIDFVLETEWVSGTLINADFASDTTLSGAAVGLNLDFSGVHVDSDQNIKAVDLTFPNLTFNAVSKALVGVEISGDTITQTTSGTSTWTGIDITLPTLVETAGTLTGYGVKITGGTLTTDPVSYGVHMSGNHTTGIALAGSYSAAGIAISGTCTEYAISIGGTYDHGIYFTEDPAAADVTNSFINIGNYTTGIAVAPTTANMFGVMHNVTLAVNVAYWYQAYYTKITTSGTTTTTSIAGHAIRMQVASSLASAYGIQCHTNITAGADATGEVISVSTMVDLGTGATTSDRVCALQAMITGSGTAGTVVGDAIVAYIVNAGTVVTTDDIIKVYNQSAATVVDGIEIENDGTMTNAIKINNDLTCSVGILFEGTHTIGLDLNGSYTTAGISMDGATFSALDNEIEMRNTVTDDKTVIASGSAADDDAIRAAVGADADIADGSLYMQVVDGAGALYIKKNDVWVAFSNP